MSRPPRPRQEIRRRDSVRWRAGSVAHAPLLRRARSTNQLPQQTEQHVQVKGLAERPVAEVLPRGSMVLQLPGISRADDDGRGADEGVLLQRCKDLPLALGAAHPDVQDNGVRAKGAASGEVTHPCLDNLGGVAFPDL